MTSQDGDGQGVQQETTTSTENITPTTPPPPPVPSADPKLFSQARTPPPLHAIPTNSSEDLFKLPPTAALRLLCAGIESLVRVTGDVPPTPPPAEPTMPKMSGMQQEKAAIVRSHSERNLARLREVQVPGQQAQPRGPGQFQGFFDGQGPEPIDGVRLRQTPTPPLAPPHAPPEPYIVIGANSQPLNLQHSAITRKFFSKAPPPISIEDYLMRIHRFCPMSTAVYLATSLYIFRLAVEERAIPVTRRNCHRLLLAGLRVAMKALEDLSYPHAKIAKVGGVSEIELARLEISFCFLAGFQLVVSEETLLKHWDVLKQSAALGGTAKIPNLRLDLRRKKEIAIQT
ncbi:cyclin-domain-containing protein [Xylariaceae sp. FL1019]|nr:cyclin-domain-containing protein [Xylariaceae sp. FL1019]